MPDAAKALQAAEYLSIRFSSMEATVSHLSARMEQMAHLAGRVTAAFIALAGLPRIFNYGMYRFLGVGGGHGGAMGAARGGSAGGGGGTFTGGGGTGSGPADWLAYQQQVAQLKQQERERDKAHIQEMMAMASEAQHKDAIAEEEKWAKIHEKNKAREQEKQEYLKQNYELMLKFNHELKLNVAKGLMNEGKIDPDVVKKVVEEGLENIAKGKPTPSVTPVVGGPPAAHMPLSLLGPPNIHAPGTMGPEPQIPGSASGNLHTPAPLSEFVGPSIYGPVARRRQREEDAPYVKKARSTVEATGSVLGRLGYDIKRAFSWITGRGKEHSRLGLTEEEQQKRTAAISGFGSRAIRSATNTFLGGSAAIGGIMGAGAPDAFGLLTGSFQLVAAQLAGAFIPAIMKASIVVQGWADTIEGWSDETKENIGTIAIWTIAISGAALVITKIGGALWGILAPLGRWTKALYDGSSSFGMFMGKMGLIAGAIGATYLIGRLVADRMSDSSDARNNRERLGRKSEEQTLADAAEKEHPDMVERERTNTKPQLEKQLRGAKWQEREWAELSRITSENSGIQNNQQNRRTRAAKHALEVGLINEETFRNLLWESGPKAAKITSEQALFAKGRRLSLERTLGIPIGTPEEKREAANKKLSQFYLGISSMKAQPQYGSIEDAYKKIQIEALGKDPLTQKLEQIKIENLDKMLEHLRVAGVLQGQELELTQEMLNAVRQTSPTRK